MYIKKILINNFRTYEGPNSVIFSPTAAENVSIITGDNGRGKTSFLTALVWCLYGKQMQEVDVAYRERVTTAGGYKSYLASCMNRTASRRGETELSAAISFRHVSVRGILCDTMEAIRTHNIATGKERFTILVDGSESELADTAGPDLFVQDFILPREIARFFFFDAERIVTIAETRSLGEQRQLSRAFNEVLGIKKYEDLRNSLNDLRTRFRRESASRSEQDQFASLGEEIAGLSRFLKSGTRRMEQFERRKDELSKKSDELQEGLLRAGSPLTLLDIEELQRTKQQLSERGKVLKSEMHDLLELAPFAMIGGVMGQIRRQLDAEAAQNAASVNGRFTEITIGKIIEELGEDADDVPENASAEVRSFYQGKVEYLLRKHLVGREHNASSDNVAHLHGFTEAQKQTFDTVVASLRTRYLHELEDVNRNLRANKAGYSSVSRKLVRAESKEKDVFVEKRRAEKSDVDRQIASLENQMLELSQKIGAQCQQLTSKEADREDLAQRVSVATKYREKDQVAARLIHELDDLLRRIRHDKKKSLEARILSNLQELLHKEALVESVLVEVEDESVDIQLKGRRGVALPKDDLSRGEQQLYAAAVLKALVDESGVDFPVFVDSPLQKFDDKHSRSVVSGFYPNVSSQVVLFPLLDRELREEDYRLLLPHIDSVYTIDEAEDDSSSFRRMKPRNLFASYSMLGTKV